MHGRTDVRAPEPEHGFLRADWLALGFLLLTGLILAWPIVTGGWLTYLDNPAHLAEIHSLAFDNGGGWSDLAWCGYPLGRLHSPLWFGGLAWLHSLGIPLGPMYGFCVLLGFFTPPVVIYVLARRWTSRPAAAGLAWLLMVQRTALVGFGTALGGMWTSYMAAGAVIWVIHLLAKREDRTVDLLTLATLYGFLGITHLFAIVPAMIIFAVHLAVQVFGRRVRRFLLWQGAAAGLGALASAAYWAPLVLAGDGVRISPLNLNPGHLMARLFLPMRMPDLMTENLDFAGDLFYLEALPPIVLVALGLAGMWVGRKMDGPSRLPLYGFLMSWVLLVLLLVAGILTDNGTRVTWLGHVSWRLLYFVRIGFALSALPLLARLGSRVIRRNVWSGAAVSLLLISVACGLPLRRECLSPRSERMEEVRDIWAWLKSHRTTAWGRVYLQDPFHGGRGEEAAFANSHVMAMTAMNTGIHQLGPLYGGSPFPNVSWLLGESGRLFGRPLRNDHHLERLMAMLPLANVTSLVLHHTELPEKLTATNLFLQVYRTEHFAVLVPVPPTTSQWVAGLTGDPQVTGGPVTPGDWKLTVEAERPGASVLMKASWSPHWRLSGPDGADLDVNNSGLVEIVGLPAGTSSLRVRFQPPRWPDVMSLASWFLIGVAWVTRRRWSTGMGVDSAV